MTLLPRDDILARTDLPALADELLGPRRGHGAHATWPCPSHEPQTGRTPPVSVFATRGGEQRWHCHACGAGGTAIDLLIATTGTHVRGALETLVQRTTTRPFTPIASSTLHSARPPRGEAPVDPNVRAHVERCAELIWTDRGRDVRDWLHQRGFHDDTLHAHRVGADPGPRHLDRAYGLPRSGPAVILPVIERDAIVYFQARYLDPEQVGRKYDNPHATLAPNPRLAHLTTTDEPPAVFVCEGLPDALTITQHGHDAVGVLGVGLAGPQIARRLHDRYPTAAIRVAFDNDPRGADGRERLLDELHELGHTNAAAVELPREISDLNHWHQTDPQQLDAALSAAALSAVEPSGVTLEP